jgi:hypothetical protein
MPNEAQNKAPAAKQDPKDKQIDDLIELTKKQSAQIEDLKDGLDDVKAEVVTSKPAPVKPAPLPEPEKGKKWYRNMGNENAFTEVGRCMPGQPIQLTEDQAKQYKGLEPCQ